MRILWHSVPSIFNTGYGIQTRLFTKALKDAGHEVLISSITGNYPVHDDMQGIRTLSQGTRQNYGNDFIQAHIKYCEPDLILSMVDSFIIDNKKVEAIVKGTAKDIKPTPWIAWQVIDSAPLFNEILKNCKSTTGNLAMSIFGKATMRSAGIRSQYVPLALDPVFQPIDRDTARAHMADAWSMDLSGRKIIVTNCANMSYPSRKNFSGLIEAFVGIREYFPDALLYIHTEMTGQMCKGLDLRLTVNARGLDQKHVIFAPQYEYNMGTLTAEYLQYVYSAADLYLHAATGEGFGLPLIEAQSCGCPVVCPSWSSMGELVMSAESTAVGDGYPVEFANGSFHKIVNPKALTDAAYPVLHHSLRVNPDESDNIRKMFHVERIVSEDLMPAIDRILGTAPTPTRQAVPQEAESDAGTFLTRKSEAQIPGFIPASSKVGRYVEPK